MVEAEGKGGEGGDKGVPLLLCCPLTKVRRRLNQLSINKL